MVHLEQKYESKATKPAAINKRLGTLQKIKNYDDHRTHTWSIHSIVTILPVLRVPTNQQEKGDYFNKSIKVKNHW